MKKEKMSLETKYKLMYCGELIIIALIVIVIGILKLTGVIQTKPTRLLVYNIITTVGGVWFITDLIWALASPKRRKRVCLLDKFMVMPVGLYLLAFDIICFINRASGVETNDLLVKLSVGIVLLYVGVVYIFQGIYHFYKPVPQIYEAIEEAKQALEEQEKAENENKEEPTDNQEVEDEKVQ